MAAGLAVPRLFGDGKGKVDVPTTTVAPVATTDDPRGPRDDRTGPVTQAELDAFAGAIMSDPDSAHDYDVELSRWLPAGPHGFQPAEWRANWSTVGPATHPHPTTTVGDNGQTPSPLPTAPA